MEWNSAQPPPPAFESAAPPEATRPGYSPELEEEEEYLLHSDTAAATARKEVHWDETSTGGEESKEELEMIEGEGNVELSGNSGFCCAITSDVVPLIDEQEVYLSE